MVRRSFTPEQIINKLREAEIHINQGISIASHPDDFTTRDDLIFATVEGKPLNPGVLSHNFARIARRAGLDNTRFHDLRHTFASLMLLRGAKPKVISEALGHSSVAFTMDVYSHIIEGMQSDAMALLDGVLPEAKKGGISEN
jgi:integrase